jgi:thimet oligopeptidase
MRLRSLLVIAAVVSALSAEARQVPVEAASNAPFFTGVSDPASLTQLVETRLARAQQRLDALLAVKGTRTIENTLRPYDDIRIDVDFANALSRAVLQLHPNAEMRKTGEVLAERTSAFLSDLALSRGAYDALASLNVSRSAPEAKRYVQRELAAYRLQGVEKDEATRQRIRTLREEHIRLMQEFQRNTRAGVRRFQVASAAELDGLPADFIAAHKPGPDGTITLTTAGPDLQPVLTYARNEALRRRMLIEANNVAYPDNKTVIERLVATRAELARLQNHGTWADYDTADRMAGSARAVADFIDQIITASGPKAAKETAMLLERKRQDFPGATTLNAWERRYYTELVRRADYAFDSQSVRPYFPFDRVRDGVLDISSRLFGFEFRRAPALPVWHPAVEPYEVFENGQLVGRIYLDMHPRADKGGGGASALTVRGGVNRRQVPEVVLIARMPGGQAGDPGLLLHDDVVTFFHEFGHVLHALASGRLAYVGLSRVAERDFIEAPSQVLEEWARDPATLALFAKHYQTGEAIPARLVNQMRRAGELGRAIDTRQQMLFARISLSLHDRDPKDVDIDAIERDLTNKYVPMPYVDGTHFSAGFSHLANPNYTASYYTYMWSQVIAKDLFDQFDTANLLDPKVMRRYRDLILAPAGSKPAARLVEDFLGRPFNAKAWEKWLNTEVH